jgi:2-phospho-L-lactate/phosphoenolpyruvate guanylyltransferase
MRYILIPCKPLREGKSRLAGVLSAAERQALCRRLLRRSLTLALTLQPAAGVRVVTPDSDASEIAAEQGVATIDDGGVNLNDALRRGRAAILDASGGDAAALILPIDLPYATADAVGRALAGAGDVVLAPDAEMSGTNLLYLGHRAFSAFAFAFGANSFAAHRDGAIGAGLKVEVLDDPRLAFDLDRPEDYERWKRGN